MRDKYSKIVGPKLTKLIRIPFFAVVFISTATNAITDDLIHKYWL